MLLQQVYKKIFTLKKNKFVIDFERSHDCENNKPYDIFQLNNVKLKTLSFIKLNVKL